MHLGDSVARRKVLRRVRAEVGRRRHVHWRKRWAGHGHASRWRHASREISCKLPKLGLLLDSRGKIRHVRPNLRRCKYSRGPPTSVHSRRTDLRRCDMKRRRIQIMRRMMAQRSVFKVEHWIDLLPVLLRWRLSYSTDLVGILRTRHIMREFSRHL